MTSVIQHVVDAISTGSLFALFALGVAFIFGVANIVNFAHGALIMVGAYLVLAFSGLAWPVLVLAVIASVVVLAVALNVVAFKPVRGAEPITVLVVSFLASSFMQGAVVFFAGSRSKGVSFGSTLNGIVEIAGVRIQKLDLIVVAVTLVLMAAIAFGIRRSAIGRQLRAAAEDLGTARLLGVRANVVVASAFALSGVLAAVAAVLYVAQTGTVDPSLGLQPVLIAFVATVIGGLGSLLGAVVGGYILGALDVALEVLLPGGLTPYRVALLFVLVIVMLLLRPQGLFTGAQGPERV